MERSLTWKYFWQQKREEILDGFLIFCSMYLWVGWFIGMIFLMFAFEDTQVGEAAVYTGNWWAFIPIVLWVVIVSGCLTVIFNDWIDSNWKKAEKRAKKELKDAKRGKDE